jgi:hypothetical protein
MGADVVSTKHEDMIFTRNWYAWRPLWDFCYEIAPDLISEAIFEAGHANGGLGLNEENARELGRRLRETIIDGRAAEAVREHKELMYSYPDEICRSCDGTGKHEHDFAPWDFNEKLPATVILGVKNALAKGHATVCNGGGKVRPGEAWYALREKDIALFADYLADCGGFEVV